MPRLDHNQIQNILPQTNPFVFIDYVEDYKEGESLTAVKNVTANERPFTKSHTTPDTRHTGTANFPETLLIEAAAQAALILYHVSKVKDGRGRPKYFIGKCKAEFNAPVACGASVRLRVTAGKLLDTGGYTDIDVLADKIDVAKITIFFSVQN